MTVSAHSKPNYSFSRAERLTSKIKIEELFKKGSSLRLKKIKIILLSQQLNQDRKVLISVPKKNHKTAVKRNRIKRIIREVYRKNKGNINAGDRGYLMAIIYLGQSIPNFIELEGQLINLFKRLDL